MNKAQEIQLPYGATYNTNPDRFGEITNVFEVPADWQGFRFHGYCLPTSKEVEDFFRKSLERRNVSGVDRQCAIPS